MNSIIITGASSGIGAVTARYFLEKGWRVGLMARTSAALEDVAAGHANAVCLPCSVTDEVAVDEAFESFSREHRLDVLFNNAGQFGPQMRIDELKLADWLATVDVNLTGMFLCARASFRIMRQQSDQGGRIINNGSISAHTPREGSTCYTTTKHGVSGLTKTITLDGRPFGIACGQIDIGNARTDLVASLEVKRATEGLAPLPTMAIEDVAKSVFHMASLPEDANVQTMMVMASAMPHIGRG